MRPGRLVFAFTSATTLALAAPALADAPAAPITALLASAQRAHPLADDKGRIPVTVPLPPGADARALGLLPVAPGIGAARLSPAAISAFATAPPELRLAYSPPLRPLLDWSGQWNHTPQFRKTTGADGKGVIVGVVDTGIDIHHPDFRDKDGRTRIAWLLVVGRDPAGLHPDLEDAYGCTDSQQSACAIYAAADIDDLIKNGDTSIRDTAGHGTHVTSIAAGNGGVMINDSPKFAGAAPEATLVVVSASSGGGFSDADVLNGARFVFDRADAMKMPAALNLSVGGDFGAHDGTSDIEKGLAAMVGDDKPGRAIVTAAGNSGALYDFGDGGPSGVHTEAAVSEAAITRVPIHASKATKSTGFVWITFRPGDDVEVALEGPGGDRWVDFTSKGAQRGYDDKEGTTAGVVNNLLTKTSTITPDTNSAVVLWSGKWDDNSEFAVLMRGKGEAQMWVVGQGDVLDGHGISFRRAVKQGTVAVPASHPNLLAVGCTVNRIKWKPLEGKPLELDVFGGDPDPVADSACYFSSSGPTPFGVAKPEISAPGALVVAAMSAAADPREVGGGIFHQGGCPDGGACYVIDDHHAMTSGTSMSAPQVTGAIALLMQLDPTLTQARATEVLQAGARRPTGRVPYDFQLGTGALDLEGALAALGPEPSSAIEPDLAKSWYTLSSAYARPDLTWPVWGTLQLRSAEGTLAGGVDEKRLGLLVTNGKVVQPLTRVRHGMWRFAVAGEPGMVGTTMNIDITYDGVSLGARSLPIGTDAWTSSGEVKALGGCGCRAAGSSERAAWPGAFALAALALGAARRRKTKSQDL